MPEAKPKPPYVRLSIYFVNDGTRTLDCPLEIGGNYQTSEETAFLNGLSEADDWFVKTDLSGQLHAFRLAHIQLITAKAIYE